MRSPGSKSKNAFSLVEVSLALAIVGIAFTVIIGMLPVGLRQSRAATDTTNDARILSAMTAIVQSTEYANLPELEGKIYCFDIDGGFLEVMNEQDNFSASRVYQAAVLLSKQPNVADGDFESATVGRRVHIIQGRISSAVTDYFKKLAGGQLSISDLKKNSLVKVTPVIIAKMDNKVEGAN